MTFPYMPFYIGDHLRDTRHLSTEEQGAYLLLIFEYWSKGSLPDDDKLLARITGLSPMKWGKLKPVIEAFFHDGWSHKRVDAELAKAEDLSAKRQKAANQRWKKADANADAHALQMVMQTGSGYGSGSGSQKTTPVIPENDSETNPVNDGWNLKTRESFHRHERTKTMDAARGRWREILPALGVPNHCLNGKAQPCPACGGKDRFRFDDRHGDGDFYCNQCNAGKGLSLLMKVNGWDFAEAAKRVDHVIGNDHRIASPRPLRNAA